MDKTIFFAPPHQSPAFSFAQLCHLLSQAAIPHVTDGGVDSFGRCAIYFGNEAELLVACPTLRVKVENGIITEGILICEGEYENELQGILQFFANIHWDKNESD